ncbi:hypothetical protein EXIGLDRAFT_599773 [Exidia glandulosa HHB12029]|uniref:Long chronological lifespan protein 2 n=1 Tax=Exidia glandulosa HHB12029 TaxID=1314781 RepID=A0A165QL84_EXIGL|nr:hypothetical protein EXIGLDRAFT_599773 [Exidia glandulosa HHB12029]
MLPRAATYIVVLPALVAAQFGDFFQHMFHGGQQHQQQQRPSASAQYAAFVDQVPCAAYLCPQTMDCVNNPAECPCPNPAEDIKCLVPDAHDKNQATVVCTRGANGCADVERLMNR